MPPSPFGPCWRSCIANLVGRVRSSPRSADAPLVMNAGERPDDSSAVNMLELLVSEALGDDGAVTEVIRPAAIIPEEAARPILMELAMRDYRNGGLWLAEPSVWRRFDRACGDEGEPQLIGSIQVTYGTPTRYE